MKLNNWFKAKKRRKCRRGFEACQYDPGINPPTCCFILPSVKRSCPTELIPLFHAIPVYSEWDCIHLPCFVPYTTLTAFLLLFATWPSSHLSICSPRSLFFLKLSFYASARSNPFLFVSWLTVYRMQELLSLFVTCQFPLLFWKIGIVFDSSFLPQHPAQGLHLWSAKYTSKECLMLLLGLIGRMLLCSIPFSVSSASLPLCLKCPFPFSTVWAEIER